jgi:serine/threonine protein kinase
MFKLAELFNTVVKWKRDTRERLTFHYFSQLMSGVKYLHDTGFAHRDLKLENLLLSKDGLLKIADFGVSKQLKFNPMMTCCGSPDYIAPGNSSPYHPSIFANPRRSLDVLSTKGLALCHSYAET